MIEHILSLDDEVDKDMYLVTLEHLLYQRRQSQ